MLSPSSEKYNHTQKWVERLLTLEDFLMCGHIITTKLKETCQVTEVFDISQHWEILLEFPFVAAAVTLSNLKQQSKVYSGWCQSQIAKIICRYTAAFLHGRIASCIWTCSLQSRILLLSHHMLLSPASVTKRGSTRRSCSVSPSF